MRITDITTTVLRIPDLPGIQDATIRQPERGRGGLFVHIQTDAGPAGLGVGVTASRSIIHDVLKPLLVGQDALAHEKLWDDMFWRVRGFGRKGVAFSAISSIDIALWDLKAKFFEVPLYRLLGPFTDSVPIYGSGGWTSFTEDELVREQVGYVERGIPRIKMKVAIGDNVEIYVDANNGFYAKQAIGFARRMGEYDVRWFEEPVLADDIAGLAAIARAIDIPVATGEHEYTKYGFKELITQGGADIVQPDVGRVGGVTEWLKVAHLAHAFNLPIAPHAVQLVHLHLACCTPNLKVVEYLGVSEETDRIMFTEFPQPKNGMWSPYPDRPGLGLELNPKAVERYAV